MKNQHLQKILAFFFSVTMLLALAATSTTTAIAATTNKFAGGSGTSSDPYLIKTKEHLNNVRNNLSAHYKMIANIAFTKADFEENGAYYNNGSGWLSIGDLSSWSFVEKNDGFTGVFDGNGYYISGITINVNPEKLDYTGLFACNNGTIQNLTLRDSAISIKSSDHVYAGGITGLNYYGIITNSRVIDCTVRSVSTKASSTAGGIAGFTRTESKIQECYNTGNVCSESSAYAFAGGIVGAGGGNIKNCYNTSYVNAKHVDDSLFSPPGAGGIIGSAQSTSITNCYNVGYVSAYTSNGSTNAGGICGSVTTPTISNCFYLGSIQVGTGSGDNGTLKCTDSSMKDNVTFKEYDFSGTWTMAGATDYHYPELINMPHVGTVHSKEVKDLSDYIPISSKDELNAIRENPSQKYYLTTDITFTEKDFEEGGTFYNNGAGWLPIGTNSATAFSGIFDGDGHKISGLKINHCGESLVYIGLFGYSKGIIRDLVLTNCTITAKADTATLDVGGIVGYNTYNGSVIRCSFDGTINAQDYTGGLVGYNSGVIEECYNSGNIVSSDYAGGIAGNNYKHISNCYNCGAISSNSYSYAGGIAATNSGSIELCYNAGNVRCSNYKGGICGKNSDIVSSCYYMDTILIGSGYGADTATKCNLSEMHEQKTFKEFDFDFIWTIDASENYPLPMLKHREHIAHKDNATDFASGTGDAWSPYVITTTTHLNNVRNNLNAYYVLGDNIVFAEDDFSEDGAFYNDGHGWLPIGTQAAPFIGSFDGKGYSIKGLQINSGIEGDTYIGLFGRADHSILSTIQNINAADFNINILGNSTSSSSSYSYVYAGAIVGDGSVNNCTSSGKINFAYTSSTRKVMVYAGGMIGSGSATNCTNNCDITTDISSGNAYVSLYIGGIAGKGHSLSYCRNNGSLYASSSRTWNSAIEIGGIAGYTTSVTMSSNAGDITGTGGYDIDRIYVGGILGRGTDLGTTIDRCYNIAVLRGAYGKHTGGIVGYLGQDSMISDSFNAGPILGGTSGYNGGIAGYADGSKIKNCYNIGYIKDQNGDGIVDRLYDGASVENCYCIDSITKVCDNVTICTQQEMQNKETFVGFDFDTVWQIGNNDLFSMPELKNIPVNTPLANIADAVITLKTDCVRYNDAQPKFDIAYDGRVLELGKDYIAYFVVGEEIWAVDQSSYRHIRDVGTGSLLIFGVGDFAYSTTIEFDIAKYDLSNARIRSEWTRYFEYDGSPKEQAAIELYDSSYYGTISPEHYNVTYINNVEIGTATMIITGVGDYYTGTLEKQFEIRPRSIQSVQVSKAPNKLSYNSCHKNRNIDVTGGEITVYYKDGFYEVFSMDATMLQTKTFFITSGYETVWLSYNGNITSYKVYVYAEHEYTTTVYAPTYTSTGYTVYTCLCGESYISDFVDIVPIPIPNVVAKNDSQTGKITLNWDYSQDFIYEIYRASSKAGKYDRVHVLAEFSWIDTSAAVGKTYYYKVKAVYADNTGFSSGFSNVISANSKCAAPTLIVQTGSTGKPVLTWNKITGAKKYEIWRSVDGGAFKKLTTSTKLTYTDSKATAGAECIYKVKALGSKSAYNGEFSSTGSCYVTCAAPSLTLKVDSKTGIPALSWKKITGAKSYAIYRSANSGEYELLTTTTAVSYKDSTAQADNKYSYYVVTLGKAEAFNSVPSAAKSVTLAVKAPKLSGSATAEGKPVISWTAAENAVAYEVYRSTKSSKGFELIATVTDLSYTDPTVAAGKTFYYKVVAVGTNTESAQSSYLKVVGKCATPTIQVTINEDSGKPMLSWEKIEGAKKYTVYRATSENGKYKKLGTSTKLTYTDTKATVGTTYFYKIVANPSSSSANSNYSNVESCLTICAKAVVTAKIDAATGKPTLSWKKITGAKTYEIYRSENGGESVLVATQTAVSYKDSTAEAGNTYSYQVKVIASKTGADSPLSAKKTVTATCPQPKLKGKVGATGKPELTWGEVESATKYVIYRSTSKSKGYTVLNETEDLSFTDTTAVKSKTYYYKIVAICGDIQSTQSAYVKVKSK